MSRTVHLPVQSLDGLAPGSAAPPQYLTVSMGAEDELPGGPLGFDVLHDGSFVVADHLQQRLAFYDSSGAYIDAWPLDFAPVTVAVLEDGLEVRDAATGDFYHVDDLGSVRPLSSGARSSRLASQYGEPRLDRSRNRGQITWPGARDAGPATLEVSLASDTAQMVSLGSLGTDRRGYTYAVLETAGEGETIRVQKRIHIFDAAGRLAGRIMDIPDDYFVHPVDAFRVRGSSVYQLVPREEDVAINIWDVGRALPGN